MNSELSEDENQIIFDQITKVVSSPKSNGIQCRGLGYELYSSMKKFVNNVGQRDVDANTSLTYGEILTQATRVALNLKDRNIKEDDVICLCSYNHSTNVLPVLASLFVNVKFASIDPSSKIADAIYLLKQINPKICFIVPESMDLIKHSLENAGIESEIVVYDNLGIEINSAEGCTPFSDFLRNHEDENHFVPEETDPSNTCCIYFSSGSTGLPKGVCVTHKQLFFSIHMMKQCGIIEKYPAVILCYSSFYWISSILFFSLATLNGGARIISREFHPIKFWDIIEKCKATFAFITPFQACNIISVNKPENVDASSLGVLLTGGSVFSTEVSVKLRELLPGTIIGQGYGMTEGGMILFFNYKNERDRLYSRQKLQASGRPVPGLKYKVVDPETEIPCDINARGELRVKSDYFSNGYDNTLISLDFDEDGYLKTGDIVYFDKDFCFFVVDRIKELLKYRNMQISPAHLENVLAKHPSVEQAIVVGIPHKSDGDHPVALVIPRENCGTSQGAIEKYVNERVDDAHQLRGGVKFVESFPLTASGKVKRTELKRLVLEGLI